MLSAAYAGPAALVAEAERVVVEFWWRASDLTIITYTGPSGAGRHLTRYATRAAFEAARAEYRAGGARELTSKGRGR